MSPIKTITKYIGCGPSKRTSFSPFTKKIRGEITNRPQIRIFKAPQGLNRKTTLSLIPTSFISTMMMTCSR